MSLKTFGRAEFARAIENGFTMADHAAGRLASVSVNGSLQGEYLYNALGQQVKRTVWTSGAAVVTAIGVLARRPTHPRPRLRR